MTKTFEVRIWEKAEHWHFDTTIEAINEQAAYAQLRKDYPPRSYSIREVRQVWRAAEAATLTAHEVMTELFNKSFARRA